jgi:Uma2 family endonuclease
MGATESTLNRYLGTLFRPDCDYVDGEILERNVGEFEHSFMLSRLLLEFSRCEAKFGMEPLPSVRMRVSETRFRVPDVCVVSAADPFEKIVTRPPLLCVEILSSEDRWARITERFEDYRRMGVPTLWAVDPIEGKAWAWSIGNPEWKETIVLDVPGTPIRIDVAPIFAELAGRKSQQ